MEQRATKEQVIEAFISAYNGDLDKGTEHANYYLSKRTELPKLAYYAADIRRYVNSSSGFKFKGIKKENEVFVQSKENPGYEKVNYIANLESHNATDFQWQAFFKLQHNCKTIEEFVGSEIGKEYLNKK